MTEPHALYRFYDADRQLLYVGITGSLFRRISRHGKTAHWEGDVAHIDVEWHPDRASAATAETAAIRSERPLYNIAQSPYGCRASFTPLVDVGSIAALGFARGRSVILRVEDCTRTHVTGYPYDPATRTHDTESQRIAISRIWTIRRTDPDRPDYADLEAFCDYWAPDPPLTPAQVRQIEERLAIPNYVGPFLP